MSADLVAYLLGKEPRFAIVDGGPRDMLTLMNAINRLNDGDPQRPVDVVIPAIRLRALRDHLGQRFELWRSVLRAKNVVVTSFDEQDAIAGASEEASAETATVDALVLDQARVEGYVVITRVPKPDREEAPLRASHDEVLDAALRVLSVRASLRVMRDSSSTVEARLAALEDLVDARHEDLPLLLADALERSDHAPAWRDALIFAVEHTQVTDPALRERLVASLLRHALALRDEGREGPLWSAVRRYASMVPVEASDGLLAFLRPEDVATTKQVALQGIFNIFSVERPRACDARDRLRERVHSLAVEPRPSSDSVTPEIAALTFCSVQAAAVLEDPDLEVVVAGLEALNRPRLTERMRRFLSDLSDGRSRGVA